ncbi:MAG: N-acetylmuramoyl-L-alanine amidase [Acidobacteriota bacterium]
MWTAFRSAGLIAIFGFLCLGLAAPGEASTLRRSLDNGMVASLTDDDTLFLEAKPLQGEGLLAFTRRLTGATAAVDDISRLNRRPRRLLSGVRYKVPYAALRDSLKIEVIQALFPGDQVTAAGWRHQVPKGRSPTLWRVTEWFTGRGNDFSRIGELNRLDGDYALRGDQVILIPRDLLSPPFLGLLPPPGSEAVAEVESSPSFSGTSTDGQLRFESDDQGDYAVYRLKRGEALYSSVVVRFTGIVAAKEVNEVAADLARRNKIADVTDMPIGQRVRIPLDLLLPEYLPTNDPRRQEWEKNRAESSKYSNTVRASRLEGITVVLDAGHGGDDPGVDHRGTWESVYVYDVMLRTKILLEQTTAARVVPTTRDGDEFRLIDKDVLPRSRRHTILTSPEYQIRDTRVSANLRWYLANSHHRRAVKRTGDVGKSIFISIHADSRTSERLV